MRLENIHKTPNFELHEIAIPLFKNKKRESIIDLGAGRGTASSLLKKFGLEVKACDIDKKLFKPKDVEFKEIDLNKELPYKNEEFDNAIAIEVIEHLDNPWIFFKEVHRIMKKHGKFVVSTPNVESINSRIQYLRKATLPYFSQHAYKSMHHATPIFTWNLKRMIEKKFRIKKIYYKQHRIPFIGIKIPFENKWFGEIAVFELERI